MAPGGSQTTVGVTVAANMDVSGILNGVRSMQGAFNGLKLPANLTGDAIKQFDKLKESLTKYRELMEKGPSTKGDLKQLEKLEKTIKSSFDGLSKVYDELSGKKIYLEADATAIKNAQKDIDQLKQDVQNKLGSIKFEFSSPTKGKVDIGLNELTSDMERAVKSSKVVSASMKEMTNSIRSGNFTEASKGLTQIEQQAVKLKGASVGLLKTFQQMGLIQFNKSAEDLYKSGEHVALLHQGFEKLRGVLSADDTELKRVTKSLGDAIDKKSELEKIGERNYNNNLAKQAQDVDQLKQGYDQCAEAARGFAQQSMSAAQQVEQLQQSTQYFFSLRNMINLLKRGIDEAVQSVKELDKAMTETAVVTDYKVSDLWGMLPEYTKVANQLGATTQGAYETMTLYYQQGLKQQQAFELGAETMKMARIAGLDYAETTDMMTAALRGFNMELNETSAKRVNDVYSELAAITASDTEELGTAMQRTASIAASAGASFEGTTAFLAQAIETTREPAENIGTAMKTIVARFQELKKNPLEISEVDGEEVDYNKIDTALKTIGVDLKDANGQFRDFDQVMLDISARWDGLSQAQQRYIATTAAGSRQQSRFIAMVSNYDRTMQLMEAANNSAGASDEQFGKTMDSLESKLNQLHNAWQQFTMGIANNGMIKMAVDGLTGFLNITNKIIDVLSLGSGALKSFLSVFAAFTGLKATGRLANQLIGGLGGLVDPTSTFKQGFKGGAIRQGQTGTAQAKAISDPIVTAVNRIYGAITGKQATINQTAQNTGADFKSFKNANTEMRNFLGGIKANEKFSISDVYGKIGKLDNQQQKAVLQQLPGLQLSLQKNGINFDTTNLSDNATKLVNTFTKEINQGLKDKSIDSQGILQLFGTPDNFKRGMQARGPEYVKAAEEVLNKGIDRAKIQDEALNEKIIERDLLGARWSDDQVLKMAQKEADKRIKALQENNLREGIKGKASPGMQAANDFAAMGQAAIVAGQGVAQLGMQLSNAGFEQAGAAVTSLGYQISSLGSIAASTGTLVGKILDNGGLFGKTGLIAAHPVIAALVVAVAALGTVFAAASAKIKKIKEAGEEVTKTFTETNKTVQDNIAKLKSYQSEFAVLSKGVDSNGNNVSLDDSQYQRYLEIVDDIATINPEIVEGYNAQGHAIINNNKALAETLQTQEKIRKEALATYTDSKQLDSLIKARNVNKGYYEAVADKTKAKGTFVGGTAGQVTTGYTSPMTGDVATIADKLGLIKDFDEATLQKYGIDSLEALKSGEAQAVKNFVKHRQKIEAELNNSELKLDDGLLKGFDKLGEDAAAFDEAIKPVYDNLLTSVSNSPIFESIAPEFRDALNMGLKDLASQDLNASDMAKAASNMAQKFANLTSEGSDYAKALDAVEEAQQDFASTLDETQYEADVQPAIDELTRLKEAALSEGGAYGDALAEYLENQIQRISRFTEESSANLSEALNTATDDIAAAESALENFNNSTKSDYWTAAEGMKSIYDKATETFKDSFGSEWEKHFEGHGDKTAWEAGRALFGEDALEGISADKLRQKFKEWEPALREGEEGWYNFWQKVTGDSQLMKNLNAIDGVHWDEDDFYIPEDKWAEVAKTIGISEDMLTAMLNKGRQFANISFANWDDVRKALATSDTTIKGTSAGKGQEQNLYVKKDTWEQALGDAGYTPEQYYSKENEENRKEHNIELLDITNSTKTLRKQFDDMGVKTLPDLVSTLARTGEFTKDEIQEYAEKLDLLNGEDYDQLYADTIERLENPELAKQTDKLGTIEGYTAEIRSYLARKDVEEGHLTNPLAEAGKTQLTGNTSAADTKFERFAIGQNESGKSLTKEEYTATKTQLQSMIKDWNSYLGSVEEGIKAAHNRGDETAEAALQAEKEGILANIKLADSFIKRCDEERKKQDFLKKSEQKDKKQKEKEIQNESNATRRSAAKNNVPQPSESPSTPVPNSPQSGGVIKQEQKTQQQPTKEKREVETEVDVKLTAQAQKNATKTQQLAEQDGKKIELISNYKFIDKNKAYDKQKRIAEQNGETFTSTIQLNGDKDPADKTLNEFMAEADKKKPVITINGNNQPAKKALGGLKNPSPIVVPIKPNFQGTWEKTISITKSVKTGGSAVTNIAKKALKDSDASGIRNDKYFSAPISIGSAARGYGRLGPKGKGGPTLTGELGYEIAWLPGENRSMILGANGPQMINLPKDAVVWTHEQSKQILRQKPILAGSHSAKSKGNYNANDSKYAKTTTIVVSNSSSSKNTDKKQDKGNKNTTKAAEKIEKTSKDINSWWERISRQVKEAENKTKRIGDQITKVFNDLRASINAVNNVNKDFINKQKQIIALNQEIVNKSNQKLDVLEGGSEADRFAKARADKAAADKAVTKANKAKKKKNNKKNRDAYNNALLKQKEAAQKLEEVTPDEVKEAQKAYKEATAAYKKKKNKKNKKAKDAAKKAYDKAVNEASKKGENWETIEWQETKVTKTKKGKKKKKTTDKSEKINLSDYIEKDENGAYFVNQAKIDEVYKQSAEKAEAIQKAAYDKIDEWVDHRNEGEDNITKAEDELAKYRKDIDDTFFGWKNELTDVLRITNDIERTEAEINQLQAERERTQLHLDKLDLNFGGIGTNGDLNKYFDEFKQQILQNIELNNKEATQKTALVAANREEMNAMAALTDATVKYEDINGEVQEETEKAMYKRISAIAENGSGTGWNELSTQEKKIFARQQLFQRGLVSGNAEQGYSLQQAGLKQYIQDIKNGQIQEELGSLLKDAFDELNTRTFENLKLETEIYQIKTENEKLEQEITDKANDLNEQLYGWKNSLTKVLELTQKIEQAEKRTAYLKATDEYYNRRALSGESVSSADILATYMGQMISVVSEIQNTNEKIEAQRADLQSYLNGNELFREYRSLTNSAPNDVAIAKLEKIEKELRIRQLALEYGNIHQNEDGTVSVSYNSAKIEQDIGSRFDADTGAEIEKFYKDIIDKSNDIRDSMQSSLTKISDLQQNLIDLRQAYADNAEKVLSAYVNQQQKIIDNLKIVYSSIDNSFKELINSVRQNLQQRRKIEDNAKTEQDISRKQQRLSMLRADTAGGNQVTIAQLQKEIADAQQNYGRTLEDQLLEQMSIQGDTAAKQRERQIELLQAQHNIAKDTGIYAKQVDDWLRNGQYKDTIYTLLKNDIGVDAMTAEKRAISLASIDTDIQDLAIFPSKIDATTTAIDSLSKIIGGNEETGQQSLASEISSTVSDAVINASNSTTESFNQLVTKLFGDNKNVGAFKDLQSSIAASLTTVLGDKLFGDAKGNKGVFNSLQAGFTNINTTLTSTISSKIDNISGAVRQIKLGASPEDVQNALAKIENVRKTEKESTELTAAKDRAILAEASAKTAQTNAQAAANALANAQTSLASVNTINTNVEIIKNTLSTIGTNLDALFMVVNNTDCLPDMTIDLEDIRKEIVHSTSTTTYNGLLNTAHGKKNINNKELTILFSAGEAVGKTQAQVAYDIAAGDGGKGVTWAETIKAAKKAKYSKAQVETWNDGSTAFRNAMKNWSRYATGGLADYTGPAWLDGTPSRPELVLNATDTKNFLMLRDVLSSVMNSVDSFGTVQGGDATYEININVDKLTSDYDVDKVAERVKKIIVKDSNYRNVTQVRNFR